MAVGLAIAAAPACDDRRRDDAELGGLVHARAEAAVEIDVERAGREPAELLEALGLPHRLVSEALGAHRVRGTSSVEVRRGGEVVDKLSDQTLIALDSGGGFRATLENDREYGRHAIYAGGALYLRPRYGKYHRRPPTSPAEPARIRGEMFSTVSAYFDLLWNRAELSDRGATTHDGRAARRIDISTAPSATERPAESLRQRKWRESITVEEVEGEVVLDSETGVPLEADIRGSLHFVKGGQRFSMKLAASHEISDIGQVASIEAPPAEETVRAPEVKGEVEVRRELLEGLSQATGAAEANGDGNQDQAGSE